MAFHHDTAERRARHDRNHDATYVANLRQRPDLFARFWATLDQAEQAKVRQQLANGGATAEELAQLDGGR